MALDGETDPSIPKDRDPDPYPELIPDETLCFKELLRPELNIFVLNEALKNYSELIHLKLVRHQNFFKYV